MAMQYDVKSNHVHPSGQIVTGPARVKGYQCLAGGTAGEVLFYDTASNSATGTVRLQFNIPANSNNPFGNLIPGEGIRFELGVYVSGPANSCATVFYG
jgi:hypothetical protein